MCNFFFLYFLFFFGVFARVYVCVSSDDIAAYKNVRGLERGSPLTDGWESAVNTGVVNHGTQWKSTGPEARGHKGHVQKSQSYYDKDIFIYVYIQYFHILKSII